MTEQQNPPESIRALSVLVQFCVEYAGTLKDRPATQEAVLIQARQAARVVNTALTETPDDASTAD